MISANNRRYFIVYSKFVNDTFSRSGCIASSDQAVKDVAGIDRELTHCTVREINWKTQDTHKQPQS